MSSNIIRSFWGCGDSEIIDFAMHRARLNRHEEQVVKMVLDSCMTQEEIAEELNVSTRWVQKTWQSATRKLMSIPWVVAYGLYLAK